MGTYLRNGRLDKWRLETAAQLLHPSRPLSASRPSALPRQTTPSSRPPARFHLPPEGMTRHTPQLLAPLPHLRPSTVVSTGATPPLSQPPLRSRFPSHSLAPATQTSAVPSQLGVLRTPARRWRARCSQPPSGRDPSRPTQSPPPLASLVRKAALRRRARRRPSAGATMAVNMGMAVRRVRTDRATAKLGTHEVMIGVGSGRLV